MTTRSGEPTGASSTLAKLLRHRASTAPDRTPFAFLTYRRGLTPQADYLSNRGLLTRAEEIARSVEPIAKQHDRVLILCPPGFDFIGGFFACQLAGVIAVPAHPPGNAKHISRLRAIIADSDAAAVLVSDAAARRLEDLCGSDERLPPLVPIGGPLKESAQDWVGPTVQPDDIAFLQYTSGTLGAAKGVAVTHRQALENIRHIAALFSLDEATKAVFWLPPQHDMGLIGAILAQVYCGGQSVLMAPEAFLQRPLRWLQALSHERAVITTAPNFGWQLCVDAMPDEALGEIDLSALRLALSGAEPILTTTISAFAKKFSRCGFNRRAIKPVYGLAESVLLATCSDGVDGPTAIDADRELLAQGRLDAVHRYAIAAKDAARPDPAVRPIVSCGRSLPGHEVHIVCSDTGRPCAAGMVGEVWLSGPSVADGYWGRPRETETTFCAAQDDNPENGPWLRTGDLGALVDGELYIVGRIKETMIIRGRNHDPRDIELAAEAADPVLGHGRTIAFGIDDAGVECVAIGHELTRTAMRSADFDQIARAVRRAVLDVHGIDVSTVFFVKPAQLPRTTSGKLQRLKAREAFEAGRLDIVGEWRAAHSRLPVRQGSRANADRLLGWLRTFAETDLDSRTADENRKFPDEVRDALSHAGWWGLTVPSEMGGQGLHHRDLKRVCEQLAAVDTTLGVLVGGAACLATRPILRYAKAPLRETLLRRFAAGEALPAFALTEPGAGSNPRSLSTLARSDGAGRWRLSGQKSWVGSGSTADPIVVFCQVQGREGEPDGPAAFLVPGNARGLTVEREATTMGLRAMVQADLRFDDILVDDKMLLGSVGDGFQIAQDALAFGRLTAGFGALGGMKRCLQLMHRYASRRTIGTGRLLNNPIIRARMTTLIAKTEALDSLLTHMADALDEDETLPNELYSVVKLAVEFHWEAADLLCQLLGGRGYDERNLAPQILRDARIVRIFEGPTEAHEALIGLRLLKGQSELPDYLSTRFDAAAEAIALRQGLSDLLASRIDPSDAEVGAYAPAVAEYALYTFLHAAVSKSQEVDASNRSAVLFEIEHLTNTARRQMLESKASFNSLPASAISSWIDRQAVAIGDWEQRSATAFDPYLQRDPAAWEALNHTRGDDTPEAPAHRDEDAVRAKTLNLVRRTVASCAGLPITSVEASTPLLDVGIDSLRASQIIGKLEAEAGLSIGIKEFFAAHTVRDLAAKAEAALPRNAGVTAVADRNLAIPLTFQQKRFWEQEKRPGFEGAFSDVTFIDLRGPLDLGALTSALQSLVDRHEVLRMRIEVRGDQPYQVFQPSLHLDFDIEDLNAVDTSIDSRLSELRQQIIDISKSVFQFSIIRVADEHHVVVLVIHHIATDAFTWAILHADLSRGYNAAKAGAPLAAPSPAPQYPDYAAWQAKQARDGIFDQAAEYWKSVLRRKVPPLRLRCWLGDTSDSDFSVSVVDVRVSAAVGENLRTVARTQGTTLFAVLETAFATAMWAFTGERNVVVGINPNARPRPQFDGVTGLFVSMVPLRHQLSPDRPFLEALAEARAALLGALDNQLVPFRVLSEAIQAGRTEEERAFAPLQVQFVLHSAFRDGRPDSIALDGLHARILPRPRRAARADLTVDLFEIADGSIHGTIEYPRYHHDPEGVSQFVRGFEQVLEGVATAPEQSLSALANVVATSPAAETSSAASPHQPKRDNEVAEPIAKPGSGDASQPFLIPLADRAERLPLSFEQERLWFLDKLDPNAGAAYQIARSIQLSGPLDTVKLSAALARVVSRHEVLRTSFPTGPDGSAVQIIRQVNDSGSLHLLEDLSAPSNEAVDARVADFLGERFDLERGPLFKAMLVRVTDSEHTLVLSGHHSVIDGLSTSIILREIAQYYSGDVSGKPPTLPALTLQYADYAVWQRRAMSGERLATETVWWRQTLTGAPEPITLPFDRSRPVQADYHGASVGVDLPAEVTGALTRVAAREGATLFMALQAVFGALLSRLGAGNDFVIGTAVAGRQRPELRDLVGHFVNTVAVRQRVDELASFRAHLRCLKETVLSAFAHQDVPFEAVVEAVQPTRSLSHTPLVQVTLDLFDDKDLSTALSLEGLEATVLPAQTNHAKFDLSFEFFRAPEGLRGSLSYATQLFDQEIAERMGAMFVRLAAMAALDPDARLADLNLVDAAERKQLIDAGNAAADPFEPARTVTDLFRQQVALRPDTVAIIDGDHALTYGVLDTLSTTIAMRLQQHGAEPEKVVGILMDRSAAQIAAVLAAWKAGAGCLVLDADQPASRLASMLRDAGAVLLMSSANLPPRLIETVDARITPLVLDDLVSAPAVTGKQADHTALRPSISNSPQNLAYVIYTSGSSGRPKGVMVDQRAVAALISSLGQDVGMDGSDVLLSAASPAFDVFLQDIVLSLCHGAALVILNRRELLSPGYLERTSTATDATYLELTPSAWRTILSDGDWRPPPRMRAIAGGEALDWTLAGCLLNGGAKVSNSYGPAEATVTTVTAWLSDADDAAMLGKPVGNTCAYVVDEFLNLVPVGVEGELLLGGPQLSRGYLAQPGLTADRFVADPFGDAPGARLYRTGDRVRWRDDGTLEFLGRIDAQVKIRGMRVEPGEVEAAVSALPQIAQAAVVVGDEDGEVRLIAYIVPASLTAGAPSEEMAASSDPSDAPAGSASPRVVALEGSVSTLALRAAIRLHLPEHMVPTSFVGLSALPRTASGKVDRTALSTHGPAHTQMPFNAPRSSVEQHVADAFADLLRADRVGRRDNFFSLGGHSLVAVRLVARLAAVTGKTLSIQTIFRAPTVAELGVELDTLSSNDRAAAIVAVDRACPLPLSFQQERLRFLDRLDPAAGAAYHMETALELSGPLDVPALIKAVDAVIERHESLRTVFVEGQDGKPAQSIRPPMEARGLLQVEEADEAALDDRVARLLAEPFDLEAGPLFRARLVSVSRTRHVLIIGGHHSVLDGWSAVILLQELSAYYREAVTGEAAALPDLPLQYADYAAGQRARLSGDVLLEETSWWRQTLSGIPDAIALPTDRPRPKALDYRGRAVPVETPAELSQKLRHLAAREGVTPFMILQTAFAALLSRLGAGPDVVIGTAVAGRPSADIEGVVGFFVDTIALRHAVDVFDTFRNQLRATKDVALAAFEHQNTPFELVVEAVNPVRSRSRGPIVQVMLNLQNVPDASATLELISVSTKVFGERKDTVQSDLVLDLSEPDDRIVGELKYATQLFDHDTAQRVADMFVRLLTAGVETADEVIADLPLLDDAERHEVTVKFGTSRTGCECDQSLVKSFVRQAAVTPDAVAVTDGRRAVSYTCLDDLSNRFAQLLSKEAVAPGRAVGVCLGRSVEYVAAILAVLKAGAVFVPLDPDYPDERLNIILDDSATELVVTSQLFAERCGGRRLTLVDHPEFWSRLSALPSAPYDRTRVDGAGELPATLVYTSGSSGRPKGVVVPNRTIAWRSAWTRALYPPPKRQPLFLKTPIGSIDGVTELFSGLLSGAEMVTVPTAIAKDGAAFVRAIDRHKVGQIGLSPSQFSQLADAMRTTGCQPTSVRSWFNFAEPLTLGVVNEYRELQKHSTLVNIYGASEVPDVTHHVMKESDDAVVIGRTVCASRVYVLDDRLNPCPIGVVGELYVGGDALMHGYWQRPAMTAERVIADPISGLAGARLYRTGDLALWLASGELKHMGRADRQVKIRGMRVEPGEVEAQLRALPEIDQAAVVLMDATRDLGDTSQKRLVGVIVPANEAAIDLLSIRNRLRKTLSEHMVPAAFIIVDALPLTSHGKLDVAFLATRPQTVAGAAYTPPQGPFETAVAEAMANLLGVETVGCNDDFFALGGNSLLVARLMSDLEERTGRDLPIRTIFEAPTVAELAAALGDQEESGPSADAIAMLAADPSLAEDFDDMFGAGSAARHLSKVGT